MINGHYWSLCAAPPILSTRSTDVNGSKTKELNKDGSIHSNLRKVWVDNAVANDVVIPRTVG